MQVRLGHRWEDQHPLDPRRSSQHPLRGSEGPKVSSSPRRRRGLPPLQQMQVCSKMTLQIPWPVREGPRDPLKGSGRWTSESRGGERTEDQPSGRLGGCNGGRGAQVYTANGEIQMRICEEPLDLSFIATPEAELLEGASEIMDVGGVRSRPSDRVASCMMRSLCQASEDDDPSAIAA